jgi:hypothetical protein
MVDALRGRAFGKLRAGSRDSRQDAGATKEATFAALHSGVAPA